MSSSLILLADTSRIRTETAAKEIQSGNVFNMADKRLLSPDARPPVVWDDRREELIEKQLPGVEPATFQSDVFPVFLPIVQVFSATSPPPLPSPSIVNFNELED
ncbi:unnamed protein product [Pleuronectes platessa]|uniref:Uncharacterized protein n=1 Tax=Pleuronectes platessa TaxID=8262 RepID=A0A9N7UGR7_PLEPL|nr:unnamed protein product [Pleuronectes platessa]